MHPIIQLAPYDPEDELTAKPGAQEFLEKLLRKYWPEAWEDEECPQEKNPLPSEPSPPSVDKVDKSDAELLDIARNAKDGLVFRCLYDDGDFSSYNTQSEADLALVNMMAFYCQGNAERIDRLFRQSALMRPKWDEKRGGQTYGQRTIAKAIAGVKAQYDRCPQGREQPAHTPEPINSCQISLDAAIEYAGNLQVGDGDLLAKIYANRLLFDHAAQRAFVFKKHRWRLDTTEQWRTAFKSIQKIYRRYEKQLTKKASETENKEVAKSLTAQADILRSGVRRLNMAPNINAAWTLGRAGTSPIADAGQRWDKTAYVLPVGNGVIDLKTMQLRDGSPHDRLLAGSDVYYDPQALCPKWMEFLSSTFENNLNAIMYLKRLIGYAICRDPKEQVFVILTGRGRNGKGVLLNVLAHILGDIAQPIQSEMLLDSGRTRQSNAPSPDRLALRGKGLVWASETRKENTSFDEGLIKLLTGRDTIVARPPYGRDEIRFEPTHTLLFLCNSLPKVSATDYALFQRIHVVPFNVSFVSNPDPAKHEAQRIDNLEEILKQEASGILTWCVQGAWDWQDQGLNPPQEVKDAVKQYQKDVDTLSDFLDEICHVEDGCWSKASELYEAYQKWADAQGIKHPLTGTSFGKELAKRGFDKVHTMNGTRYLGLGLKTV